MIDIVEEVKLAGMLAAMMVKGNCVSVMRRDCPVGEGDDEDDDKPCSHSHLANQSDHRPEKIA